MISASPTLFRYVGFRFLLHFFFLMLMLLGIVFIFDIVELMRRAASREGGLPFGLVLSMASLKLPEVGQRVVPFGILFGAIFTCWRLNRMHELAVIRAAGLSVWQFLSPMIVSAFLLGVLTTAIINPVSALLLTRYERMEIAWLQKNTSLVTISRTGIWLRQPTEAGYALIHADGFNQKEWRFAGVTAFFFDGEDTFKSRIDGDSAYLREGYWQIAPAVVNNQDGATVHEEQRLPTDLTGEKIEESFADPDTISFWSIPEYLNIMEESGFPATSLAVHFQALLAQPFLLVAMVLLAATFSLRPPRFRGTGAMIALGVGAGFLIFFMESILHVFGISQKISIYLAAWTPALVSLLLGVTALLHMEDG